MAINHRNALGNKKYNPNAPKFSTAPLHLCQVHCFKNMRPNAKINALIIKQIVEISSDVITGSLMYIFMFIIFDQVCSYTLSIHVSVLNVLGVFD